MARSLKGSLWPLGRSLSEKSGRVLPHVQKCAGQTNRTTAIDAFYSRDRSLLVDYIAFPYGMSVIVDD